jgi:hypothetical protein
MQQKQQSMHRGANGAADGEHTRVKDFLDHLERNPTVTKRQTYQELLLIQQEMKTHDLELKLERELRRQAESEREAPPNMGKTIFSTLVRVLGFAAAAYIVIQVLLSLPPCCLLSFCSPSLPSP